jgi:hypothetical protein
MTGSKAMKGENKKMNARLPCIVRWVDINMGIIIKNYIGLTPVSRHCGQVEH